MQKYFQQFKRLLSTRTATIVVLIIAILIKILFQFLFFSITGDKAYQLVAAQNLLAGHGITIDQLSIADLATKTYTPLVGWPPGYSLVIAPLLWVFNNNYITAALFLISSAFSRSSFIWCGY